MKKNYARVLGISALFVLTIPLFVLSSCGTSSTTSKVASKDDSKDTTQVTQEYSVKFYDGSTLLKEDKVAKDGKVAFYDAVAKPNFQFDGWAKTADGAVEYTKESNVVVTSDLSFYAVFSKKLFTLSFDVDGGEVIADVKKSKGDTYVFEEATKQYHTFDGWALEKGGEVVYNTADEYTVDSQNITFYASYTYIPDETPAVLKTSDERYNFVARPNESFTLPTMTAIDDRDGDISSKIEVFKDVDGTWEKETNTSITYTDAKTYKYKYSVTNNEQLVSEKEVLVAVLAKDETETTNTSIDALQNVRGIYDDNFSKGTNSLFFPDNDLCSIISDDRAIAGQSLLVDGLKSANGKGGAAIFFEKTMAQFKVPATYKVSFDISVLENDMSQFYFGIRNGSGEEFQNNKPVSVSVGDKKTLSGTFNVNCSDPLFYIFSFGAEDTAAKFVIDNVRIINVPVDPNNSLDNLSEVNGIFYSDFDYNDSFGSTYMQGTPSCVTTIESGGIEDGSLKVINNAAFNAFWFGFAGKVYVPGTYKITLDAKIIGGAANNALRIGFKSDDASKTVLTNIELADTTEVQNISVEVKLTVPENATPNPNSRYYLMLTNNDNIDHVTNDLVVLFDNIKIERTA